MRTIRLRTALRAGLVMLVLEAVTIGVQALFFPMYFYQKFLFGRGWVAMMPPYNEHITRDLGALYLGFGVVLGYAAVKMSRDLFNGAVASFVVATIPHMTFHAAHTDMAPQLLDKVLQVGALALTVALGLAMMYLGRGYFRSSDATTAPAQAHTSTQGALR
ncbi:hypothetical protein [Pedococcus sp. 5OH_020]|uniref:hypothetical protein n=1 Tax=Pedococcus sp. 5OH_020 TaxID=2989814 RepID=UPI0022E99B59|nr:hypothetical protein [Pedococcus sp. 5OH_020]